MRGKPVAKTSTSANTSGQEMYGNQDYTNGNGVQCPQPGLQPASSGSTQNNGASNAGDDWGIPITSSLDSWGPTAPTGGDFFDSTNQVNGDDGHSEECRHCRGAHRSSECTQSSGGRAPIKCYNCNQPGHVSNSCPSKNNGYGGDRRPDNRDCHKCGESGHIARFCPQSGGDRPNGGDRPSGGGQSARCSNCEGRGHSADTCPSPRYNGSSGHDAQSSQRSGPQQNDAVCHRCNESGHFAHNCPKRVGFETDREDTSGPYNNIVSTSEEEAVNRNNTGVNFDRYRKIQVKVTDSHGTETNEYESKKLETFEDARLDSNLMDMIRKMNYERPTPVQQYGIPILADGKDVMACAQTGSGKTAAFVLPIVDALLRDGLKVKAGSPARPYALILTPTRELTVQITKDAQQFCCRTNIKVKECYGGTGTSTQIRNITSGCHILVATTGRLHDFLRRDNVISFSDLRYLVLDEADRMLDMGFSSDVRSIMDHHTRNRSTPIQTVMFSATFPRQVQDLARDYLRPDFMKLDVGVIGTVNSDVTQFVEQLSGVGPKKDRLVELVEKELRENKKAKILVFVETKRIADTVASFLSEMGCKATSMHGDRLQEQRERALRDFQKNDCPVLVATSVAARGLDISGVGHVVNFDLPKEYDEYVHRVGRTGRVGNEGRATSFYDSDKDANLRDALRQSIIDGGQEPPSFL